MTNIDWDKLAKADVHGTFTAKDKQGRTEHYVNGVLVKVER